MPASREQINPKLTPATKALLMQYCQERHTTQSEVVEAALLAFMQPAEDSEVRLVMLELLRGIDAKQDVLHQGIAALLPLLTDMVKRMEEQSSEPAVPIARYVQLYGDLRAETAPETPEAAPETPAAPEPQPGLFRRLTMKKARAAP